TGEHTRTRRSARPIAAAIRWASFLPRPGENHGRTVVPPSDAASVSNAPVGWTTPEDHSSSKSRAKAAATWGESTVTRTFSSRLHESSVQFAEPVQTEAASRTTYFWCIR